MMFMRFRGFYFWPTLFLIGFLFTASLAQAAKNSTIANDQNRLQEIEKKLKVGRKKTEALKQKSKDIKQQLKSLRGDLVEAASRIQNNEDEVAVFSDKLKKMEQAANIKMAELKSRRVQLSRVLMGLQRVAQHPSEALAVGPMAPVDTVRSAILLRTIVPVIEAQALGLRDDLKSLTQSRVQAEQHKQQLALSVDNLARERARMRTLLGRKSRLQRRTTKEKNAQSRKVKRLGLEARNLRELMATLEKARLKRLTKAKEDARKFALRQKSRKSKTANQTASIVREVVPSRLKVKPLTGRPISKSKGRLSFPVVGRIAGRYGQISKQGVVRKGLTFVTLSGAQVTAPYEGKVVFAGKFKGYGRLLIIEHSEGYHTLLAGMKRIDVVLGQTLLQGEPVGIMGFKVKSNDTALYVEMRRNGRPVNPLSWLTSRGKKVNG